MVKYNNENFETLFKKEIKKVMHENIKDSKKLVKKKIKKPETNSEILAKKKKKMISRIPTGLNEFDNISYGGFIKDTTNIVCGSAGSGKTIFCSHFMINGVKKYNENSLMISFEQKKSSFYRDMLSAGMDFEKLEKEKKFFYLKYTPEQVKKFIEEGGGTIEAIIAKNNIKRLVIDSLNAFALLFKYEATQREACLELFKTISNWNCTALLTEEDRPSIDNELSNVMNFEVDCVIFFYNIRVKDERQRALEIFKMRSSKHSRRTHPFVISDSGINIDLNHRIDPSVFE